MTMMPILPKQQRKVIKGLRDRRHLSQFSNLVLAGLDGGKIRYIRILEVLVTSDEIVVKDEVTKKRSRIHRTKLSEILDNWMKEMGYE